MIYGRQHTKYPGCSLDRVGSDKAGRTHRAESTRCLNRDFKAFPYSFTNPALFTPCNERSIRRFYNFFVDATMCTRGRKKFAGQTYTPSV